MTQVADFSIRFSADQATFQKDVDAAKKMLRGYAKEANSANDSTMGFAKAMERGADNTKAFGEGVLDVAGAVSAGIGIIAGATTVLIRNQAAQARELEKMANLAGVSVAEIQALAYASEQYAIPGDKMADILKDVNDKLGDFAATGGGEFADFFEHISPKVGLTIDMLQKMSGPEALIAIKGALDAANVPMKQQVFYLEAIANDASALIPLLENKGQKLLELTGRYEALNVAMSEWDIAQFKQMDQQLTDTAKKLERAFSVAVLGAREQIDWLSGHISDSVQWWGEMFDSITDDPRTQGGLVTKLGDLRTEAKQTRGELEQARRELAELNTTQQNAEGNLALQARLANAGFDKRIQQKQAEIERLAQELQELEQGIAKHQQEYGERYLGLNTDGKPSKPKSPDQPSVSPTASSVQSQGASSLLSLDNLYADDLSKLDLAHQQRLQAIEQLQVSEQELTRRGFEDIAALKQSYVDKEREHYAIQQEELTLRLEEATQRELEAFQAKEDEKTRIAAQKAEERAKTEERLQQQVLSMQYGIASQSLGIIEQSAEEGSAIQKAAFMAQKVMAAAQVFINGEVAASAALQAPPVGLGPVAGAAMATKIRIMSGISAGLIMAQAIAGMAHDGIDTIPTEGTWLLNKGERVYTNESVKKLDQMHSAVVSGNGGGATVYQDFHFSGARDAELEEMVGAAAKLGAEQGYQKVVQDLRSNGTVKRLVRS